MNRKSAVLTLSIGIACAIVAVALALDGCTADRNFQML